MIKWQFQIDGRPAGPVRDKWGDAAWDAVNDGYATWQIVGSHVYMDNTQGASIRKLRGVTNATEESMA